MKNNLATSGHIWGVSCIVDDEATLGVILGYMSIFKARDIGFRSLGTRRVKREKDPAAVARGKLGGAARHKKRRPTAGRKPAPTAALEYLDSVTSSEFTVKAMKAFMEKEGWKEGTVYRELNQMLKAKRIKRKSAGIYIKLPALVKAS